MDVQTRVETRTYGTITHMAPEVLRSNQISKAADVYSFGVILWELAAGCRAWVGARLPPHVAESSLQRCQTGGGYVSTCLTQCVFQQSDTNAIP